MTVARTELSKPIEARNISESPERGEISPLSLRELEVLMFISKDLVNKEIGRELGISEGTVKIHTSNILHKLNVETRVEAAFIFQRALLISHQVNPNFTLKEFQKTFLEMAQTRVSWMSELPSSNVWESLETIGVSPLSPRQTVVLMHLSQGLFNKEIAREIERSPQTVKNHIGSIFRKLGVKDRLRAAFIFRQALFTARQENPDFTLGELEETLLKTIQAETGGMPALALSHLEALLKREPEIRKEKARREREQKEKRIRKRKKIREAIILSVAQGMSVKKIAANLECPINAIVASIGHLYREFSINGQDPRRLELLVERAKEAWNLDLPSTSPSHERPHEHPGVDGW